MKTYTNILGRTIPAFVLFFLVPSLLLAQESWSTASSNGFTKRMLHSSVVVGGKLYTIGGIIDYHTNTISKSFEVYDPNTDSWDTIVSLGTYTPRYGAVMEVIDGKIFLIGGANSTNYFIHTVDVYDIAKNEWSTPKSLYAFSPYFTSTSAV